MILNSLVSANGHCVKSLQMQSFLLFRISLYSVQIQENTDQSKPILGHFSRSGNLPLFTYYWVLMLNNIVCKIRVRATLK